METVLLTTSYPTPQDDVSGHFVQAEAVERLAAGPVTVLTPQAGTVGLTSTFEAGVRVLRLPDGGLFGWPGAAARLRSAPWRAFGAPLFLANATRELLRFSPRARIVAHWVLPCALPADVLGRRAFGTSHGGDVRTLVGLPAPLRRLALARLEKTLAQWTFVSEALREQLLAVCTDAEVAWIRGRSDLRPAALHVPQVAESAAEALREETLGALDGPLFVSVGRLVASKRVEVAIAHTAASKGVLVVVGDGPEEPRLKALAAQQGAHTAFVGKVSRQEALTWISAADALLFASQAEGCSTVLREAEALGTRVIHLP